MDYKKYDELYSKLEFNIKAEAEAKQFYFDLLEIIPDADRGKIRDIIADEINHSIILMKLVEKYSGIVPSEFEALREIKEVA